MDFCVPVRVPALPWKRNVDTLIPDPTPPKLAGGDAGRGPGIRMKRILHQVWIQAALVMPEVGCDRAVMFLKGERNTVRLACVGQRSS